MSLRHSITDMVWGLLTSLGKISFGQTAIHDASPSVEEASVEEAPSEDVRLYPFKEIGKGQCGTVWAIVDTPHVLKVTNEGKVKQLYNDCYQHKCIEDAFNMVDLEYRDTINIPRFGGWIHPRDTCAWDQWTSFFPSGFQPTHGLISERIHPVNFQLREAIVDAFAPKSIRSGKAAFLAKPENTDCLIRLYLGRRNSRSNDASQFRLRNFDLTVNEMEHLGLDTMMYARAMAQTLAVIHWVASLDANDVEFVLGRSSVTKRSATLEEYARADETSIGLNQLTDYSGTTVEMWLLDFDQCESLVDGPEDIKQLVRSFFFNDPYYPRPGSKDVRDQALWEAFKNTYLDISYLVGKICSVHSTPDLFIEAVEKEGEKRSAGGSLFQ